MREHAVISWLLDAQSSLALPGRSHNARCLRGESRGQILASAELEARLTAGCLLREVVVQPSGERFTMASPEQFWFSTAAGETRPRDCRRAGVSRRPDLVEILYQCPDFEVEKRLRLRHLVREAFALDRLSMGGWQQAGAAGRLVSFRHGQCVTYFARRPSAGLFFGVRTPFQDILGADSVHLDLSDPVKVIFNPGSTYEAQPAYWGVYHPTGRYAPKAPSKIKECVLSGTPPDLGESEAMLRMVRKLAPPRGGVAVVYNGYQRGLYFGDHGDPDRMAQAQHDIETLRIAKDMLGPCVVQPSAPFFGAYLEAVKLSPRDARLPEPPARRKVLDWIHSNGMRAMDWACLKSVHGWTRPRLGPYCPGHTQWQADSRVNCAAHPEYVGWLARIMIQDVRGGFAGFVSDEPPPGLRYRLTCEQTGHQHLRGDVSYAYFYRRREMFRKLREAFGPGFELQGRRPHMDAGIWDAVYLNSLFTFLENPGAAAESIRLWSRMRRHYSFVPSYMDQVMVQPGLEPVDYTMLSAIAKNSRLMARGLRTFPDADRKRARFWLDWARARQQCMDCVIDLPDWPGEGKCDGYLRLKSGRGFAFLFNPSETPQMITVPLSREVGLDPRSNYRLDPVHAPGAQSVIRRTEARLMLPAHSAWVVRIEPAGSGLLSKHGQLSATGESTLRIRLVQAEPSGGGSCSRTIRRPEFTYRPVIETERSLRRSRQSSFGRSAPWTGEGTWLRPTCASAPRTGWTGPGARAPHTNAPIQIRNGTHRCDRPARRSILR